ncbi:MAG: dihydropteroate synthase [Planctomycetaceae bacterium]
MTHRVWRCRNHTFELGSRTLVMGVVNVTPDSFSDGGSLADAHDAERYAAQLLDEGADLVDIGGESTRPGSSPVPIEEELRRVIPVIERVRVARADAVISVDTRHAEVATEALGAGAQVVNDVTGGRDPRLLEAAHDAGAGLVLMHMLGEPETMQDDPRYDDVVGEVREYLRERVEAAVFAGLPVEALAVDPGIGFGKNLEHNLALLRSLEDFTDLDAALLVGVSRKRFVGTLTGVERAKDRLEGSLAAATWAAAHGADVVRVHDVLATRRALAVVDALVREAP